MPKPIILSGLQPTGNLHIGNYLGAVKNLVELQNSGKYQLYLFIADLHSLTGAMTPERRVRQTLTLAAELIAAGIDCNKTALFVQSYIPEHAELAWILNCVTPITELTRMTQFKDKSLRQEKNINAGLLTYPVLQAADVLMYQADLVPVGQDQLQHLELTNEEARWFNNRYSDYFKPIKPLLTDLPKVMSLLEPDKKMSKSLGGGHVIEMGEEPSEIEAKLKKAVTATVGGGKAPGVQNLLLLLKHFADAKIYDQFVKAEKDKTIRYGDLKSELAKFIALYFAEFRKNRADLLKNDEKIQKLLAKGAQKAGEAAQKTMKDVRLLVGLR